MSQPPLPSYDFILPHPHAPQALLLAGTSGWGLPHWTAPTERNGHWAAAINAALLAQLGLVVTVLHWELYNRRDPATHQLHTVFVLDNHSPRGVPPAHGRWVGRAELAALHLAEPQHRAVLTEWFDEMEHGTVPAHRLAYQRPGWFAQAHVWLANHLAAHQLIATSPVEQLRTKYGSCMLRVGTDAGALYLKAVPSMYAHEPRVTQFLAARFPDRLPTLVATNDVQHWLLMRDHGDVALSTFPELVVWEHSITRFAELQQACALETDALLALGCPDRSLAACAALGDDLLGRLDALTPDLLPTEVAQLRNLRPRLHAAWQQLAAYDFPLTLEHGDFHPYQIVVAHGTPLVMDWSDSSVSHPFFSMARFLQYLGAWTNHPIHVHAGSLTRLRNAYLHAWRSYTSRARLEAAFALAQPLGMLQHAINYDQLTLTRAGVPWERAGMVTFFLQQLLAHADGLIAIQA